MIKKIDEFIEDLQQGGFFEIDVHASTLAEARSEKKRLTLMQKQLRQLRKEAIQSQKEIRALTSEAIAMAPNQSTVLFGIFGKRRATKSELRVDREVALKPYDKMKIMIDEIILKLDGAKLQLEEFIAEEHDK